MDIILKGTMFKIVDIILKWAIFKILDIILKGTVFKIVDIVLKGTIFEILDIIWKIRQPRREQLPGNRLPCIPLGPPNFPKNMSVQIFFSDPIFVFNFFARRRIPFYIKKKGNEATGPAEGGEEGGEGEGDEENAGNPPQRANAPRDFLKPFTGPPPHSLWYIYIL